MRFLFEPEFALYVGRVPTAKFVSHQGAALIYSPAGDFDLDFGTEFLENKRFAFIPSLLKHKFIGKDFNHLLWMVDPDHELAVFLHQQIKINTNNAFFSHLEKVFNTFAASLMSNLQTKDEFQETARAVLNQLQMLTMRKENRIETDPRIKKAIEYIKQNLDAKISIIELSKASALSESRLCHLFSEQIGMPIRKYVLWQRMKNSLLAAQNGFNLTEAAIEGGFADGAHLSRTVSAMFGATPSEILQNSGN